MSTYSAYTVEGLDLDLQEALAAAIDAAQQAGKIIWDGAQQRRTAIAAAYAPQCLPSKSAKSPEDDGDVQAATEATSPADGEEAVTTAKTVKNVLRVETKTAPNDLVTQYDTRCDAVIIKTLRQYVDRLNHGVHGNGNSSISSARHSTGGHAQQQHGHHHPLDTTTDGKDTSSRQTYPFRFITEELSPDGELTDELTWIVDPIDGTMSFVHGLPDCCVSIGLTHRKECVLAVVFCPFLVSGGVGVMQAAAAKAALANPGAAAAAATVAISTTTTTAKMEGVVSRGPAGGGPPPSVGADTPPPPMPLQTATPPPSGSNKRAIPQPPQSASSTPGAPAALSATAAGTPTKSSSNNHNENTKANTPTINVVSSRAGANTDEAGVPECVGELYVAIKGKGTFVNGIPVHVNADATRTTAMAVFNLPYGVSLTDVERKAVGAPPACKTAVKKDNRNNANAGEKRKKDAEEEVESEVVKAKLAVVRRAKMGKAVDAVAAVRYQMSVDMLPGVRAYGSCVTTLALIAAGHIDLYVEPAGKIWDVVCGSLLVAEAGGCVRNMLGKPMNLSRDTTIAAGATTELVEYVTDLCVKHRLGRFWIN